MSLAWVVIESEDVVNNCPVSGVTTLADASSQRVIYEVMRFGWRRNVSPDHALAGRVRRYSCPFSDDTPARTSPNFLTNFRPISISLTLMYVVYRYLVLRADRTEYQDDVVMK